MEDLRNYNNRQKTGKQIRNNKFFEFIFKNRKKIIIIFLILFILIFPSLTGTLIGKWVNSFIGSIVNNISF